MPQDKKQKGRQVPVTINDILELPDRFTNGELSMSKTKDVVEAIEVIFPALINVQHYFDYDELVLKRGRRIEQKNNNLQNLVELFESDHSAGKIKFWKFIRLVDELSDKYYEPRDHQPIGQFIDYDSKKLSRSEMSRGFRFLNEGIGELLKQRNLVEEYKVRKCVAECDKYLDHLNHSKAPQKEIRDAKIAIVIDFKETLLNKEFTPDVNLKEFRKKLDDPKNKKILSKRRDNALTKFLKGIVIVTVNLLTLPAGIDTHGFFPARGTEFIFEAKKNSRPTRPKK